MTNIELAKGIRHGMFASRSTIEEAWDYVDHLARSCGKDRAAVITAVQVMLNTVAEHILKNENTEV